MTCTICHPQIKTGSQSSHLQLTLEVCWLVGRNGCLMLVASVTVNLWSWQLLQWDIKTCTVITGNLMWTKVLLIVLLCVIKAAQNVLGPLGSAFNKTAKTWMVCNPVLSAAHRLCASHGFWSVLLRWHTRSHGLIWSQVPPCLPLSRFRSEINNS